MEGYSIMKSALVVLIALTGTIGPAAVSSAGLPEGKIAVVRVTAVDGLAHRTPESETRTSVFTYDGTDYTIDRSALSTLDGVSTLLLIDRETDVTRNDTTTRLISQEVRAFQGTDFEVTDLKGKVLAYQIAMIGGNLRLLGDGDQIQALAGAEGPYHVWRIDGVDLADRDAVILR